MTMFSLLLSLQLDCPEPGSTGECNGRKRMLCVHPVDSPQQLLVGVVGEFAPGVVGVLVSHLWRESVRPPVRESVRGLGQSERVTRRCASVETGTQRSCGRERERERTRERDRVSLRLGEVLITRECVGKSNLERSPH